MNDCTQTIANADSDNDDEDDQILMFLRKDFKANIGYEDDISKDLNFSISNHYDQCKMIEKLWLQRDIAKLKETLEEISSSQSDISAQLETLEQCQAIQMIVQILNGLHIEFFRPIDSSCTSIYKSVCDEKLQCMIIKCLQDCPSATVVRNHIMTYIFINNNANESMSPNCHRCLKLMIVGTLLLDLYCQANYTGPELLPNDMSVILGTSDEIKQIESSKRAIERLECDGDYPFHICSLPQLLYISRCLLSIIAEPGQAFWQSGIYIDNNGEIQKHNIIDNNLKSEDNITGDICESELVNYHELTDLVTACFPSRHLRHARACVIHFRLLQNESYENIPTLWYECRHSFMKCVAIYCKQMLVLENTDQAKKFLATNINGYNQKNLSKPVTWVEGVINTSNSKGTRENENINASSVVFTDCMLEGQIWLEWGLCQHYFQYKDKGKLNFLRGQCALGLYTLLTASPGKRTKYQREDVAQLYLIAKSSLVTSHSNIATSVNTTTAVSVTASNTLTTESIKNDDSNCNSGSSWEHGEFELGRRLVSADATSGEEAAVREVKLDQMDGGAAVNIIIEGGPKFAESVDSGGDLHSLDQATLLCLCLDVANSNPDDGLTNEQMAVFIERVLYHSSATNNNWMIHSTALLQRSWLEYERRKTADRALLQMQALLDQHTSRLTIMQSTYQSIESAAKSNERLLYIHCLSYPAQYEFKKDLAHKYLRYQVFSSALNLFKELELWDEVVTCYQLMDKPHRAELVVRERLKQGDLTPYMLTSMADLTNDESYYEQAWVLSKGRFGRAKRTLARNCFDRKEFTQCIAHMKLALAVQPLVPKSWYLMGIACMHIGDWDQALIAFTRCVQQDMEIGEAWGNMGAIYVELKDYQKAYASFTEALKQKRESWKIIENLLICAIEIQKYNDAILYMNMLLDQSIKLKTVSQNPIHIIELRKIIMAVFESSTDDKNDQEKDYILQNKIALITKIEKILNRIVNTQGIDSEMMPSVWDASAVFYQLLQKYDMCKDCRVKQFRCILNTAGWEKNTPLIMTLLSCAGKLIDAHKYKGISKLDLYGSKSLLQSALNKLLPVLDAIALEKSIAFNFSSHSHSQTAESAAEITTNTSNPTCPTENKTTDIFQTAMEKLTSYIKDINEIEKSMNGI